MPDEREAAVTWSERPHGYLVRVAGDVDAESAPRLRTVLDAAARAARPRTVVDLSRVPFADSAILHVLLGAQQAHRDLGALLVLAGPLQDGVARLLDVTGTAGFFVLAADVASAMEVPAAMTDR
ncbi:STAS domain-containing protein [Streptomyces sp. NPDC047000]|uniref:STAS domain-containing protein n=1 Tax=Streptomyces sp. NPDC047000 TaxID=3155474 RepID=UPI0033C7DFB8